MYVYVAVRSYTESIVTTLTSMKSAVPSELRRWRVYSTLCVEADVHQHGSRETLGTIEEAQRD